MFLLSSNLDVVFLLVDSDNEEDDVTAPKLDAATVTAEDAAFLFFRAKKERLRLALSREAPLVIHLFVMMAIDHSKLNSSASLILISAEASWRTLT